jgi:hypothetical protein
VEQVLDRAQFRVPPGQRRLKPVDPLGAADRRQHPGGPPQPGRIGFALQPVLRSVGEPDRATRQPLRRRVGQHRAWFRGCLHPGRGIDRIPGDHPLPGRAQVHRDLTGDHPGPRRQARNPGLGPEFGDGGH